MLSRLKYAIAFGVLLFCFTTLNAQNVGINTAGTAPAGPAGLDVSSTNKGVLIPRIALTGEKDVATISSPANSLMIYNTATAGTQPYTVYPGFYYWQDSLWTRINDRSGTVILTADVINNTTTVADVTGLRFPVAAGVNYHFKFFIVYTSASSSNGSRWNINGPAAPTNLKYHSSYSLSTTTKTTIEGSSSYSMQAVNAGSAPTTNIAEIEGIITPSATGFVIARFASEALLNFTTITAKANLSYVQWEVLK